MPQIDWLFLDLNSYFASCEQQERPELRGCPVAIVPAETDSTCAIAASYEAKAFGIRTGTPIYEAKKLCPQLICVPARHEVYVDYHHRILEELDRHIPIESICSIDEVACTLTGPQKETAEACALALRIKAGLRENIGEYMRCSIGLAPNKYLAKVATNLQKPDGLVVLTESDLPHALYRFHKLTDLPGIGHNMERRLHRAGIFDLPGLWQLSPGQMKCIWGSIGGARFWYALHGIQLTEFSSERSTIGHSHVMAPELRPPAKARLVARRLMCKAASRLRRMRYYATEIAFSARLEKGGRAHYRRRILNACDNFVLLSELEVLWRQFVADHGLQRIKKISVSLNGLVQEREHPPDLFDTAVLPTLQIRQKREAASLAMDILNARFGRDTVTFGPAPNRSHRASAAHTKIAFTRIPEKEEFWE